MINSILIIDDTLIFRAVLSEYFQKAGWQVFQAEDGAGGIKSARDNRPRFIICDMVMPNGSGLDVCRCLRAEPDFQNTKFVMYSGKEEAATRQAAFDAGADVYVLKPVSMADVLDLVRLLRLDPAKQVWNQTKSPRVYFAD